MRSDWLAVRPHSVFSQVKNKMLATVQDFPVFSTAGLALHVVVVLSESCHQVGNYIERSRVGGRLPIETGGLGL